MGSNAQGRIIRFLRTEPGNRSKIATVETMAQVSQPTIYRMVAKGLIGKVDGSGEVFLKEPVEVHTTERVAKIKGGFTAEDRKHATSTAAELNTKLDYIVQHINRLVELSLSSAKSQAAVIEAPVAAPVRSAVEKKDPLADLKKKTLAYVKNNKTMSWADIQKRADGLLKKLTPIDKFILMMNLEHQFNSNSELLQSVIEQLQSVTKVHSNG